MGLATAINGAVGCTQAEISSLLQAVEIIEDARSYMRSVRTSNIFGKNDLSRLILRNAPEPGVRNDGSYHPGKTLAPIEVARDKFENALIRQTLNV